ncbi:uncharacterized protein LOC118203768 [Stegodyphus dumicola]|uniref:uncharacterized protein LOC118203768 n=1 Tax=Stegodyphus dumicola TaxID=202533 RepID=UPI0015B119FD|nr:uncharacterized protein LOC118203768 [Stegodyphus dumicola]
MTERNLKTQNGVLQAVISVRDQLGLRGEAEDFVKPQFPHHIRKYVIKKLSITRNPQNETNDHILKSLETINDLYSESKCLHVFMDGSVLANSIDAGAGVFCKLFPFLNPAGKNKTAFDAEIRGIRISLSKLQCQLENFSKVVILADSKAAFLAISSFTSLLMF